MRRLRRPLVWLPLVVLSTFFALCGWRNWHLSMSDEHVWDAIPISKFAPQNLDALSSGQTLLVCMQGVDGQLEPISSEFLAYFGKLYPNVHLISSAHRRGTLDFTHQGGPRFNSCLRFGKPRFQGRFKAECHFSFNANTSRGGSGTGATLVFTRSPIKFWDNQWHVMSLEEDPVIGSYY